MATSYKSYGSFSSLFMPLTDTRRAVLRRSYPSLYELFDVIEFEHCRPYITKAVKQYLQPADVLNSISPAA